MLSGELGIDLEADARAGQCVHQLVAEVEDDGEVGLDVGLVRGGRGAQVAAGGAAVVAEARGETRCGRGGTTEYQRSSAGAAAVAASGFAAGEPAGCVRLTAQVDHAPGVAGVDGEFAHARQFAAEAGEA